MKKPIQGTNHSDLNLVGTNKSDQIQGKGGDDFITGGKGNDDIDGGKGFDTAIFSGSFFDYSFSIKDRCGNDKITVTDSVVGRDGSDSLKHVEALQFSDVTIRLDQNNAAITRADAATTDEDSSVIINVLGNDVDFEGDALTITHVAGQAISVGGSVVLANGAVVTLNADQTLTYDPSSSTFQTLKGGEQGNDSFTYTVTDSHGAVSAPEDVNVTVNGLWETPTYIADGFVDEVGQKLDINADPLDDQMINGTGIPADHFGLVRAEDAGIELGLQVIYRQGPAVTTLDDYADGVLHFAVNDGPQSTANDSFANVANRAAWNFEFSIATGLNGETTDLDDFTFKLLVDVDPSAAQSFVELHLVNDPSINNAGPPVSNTLDASGYVWEDASNNLIIPDDDGVAPNVTQNSQNYAFYGIPGYNAGTGFAGPAQFDIILQAYDISNTLIGQNHISVDVIL